jgi:hypothetical protein
MAGHFRMVFTYRYCLSRKIPTQMPTSDEFELLFISRRVLSTVLATTGNEKLLARIGSDSAVVYNFMRSANK